MAKQNSLISMKSASNNVILTGGNFSNNSYYFKFLEIPVSKMLKNDEG